MADDDRSTVPGTVLTGVGVVLVLIALVWVSIIGYYPQQLPVILVIGAAGVGAALYGRRLLETAKRENALRSIARRDSGQV
ncbi:hypothetical protein [Rathayibacter sp. VKM Ac-2760]|uniref:hypothetical protein n=1 Tax=Rathayibacter sp. VKM Ac-2760 TaxID=2609253 RepID=UPI0013180BB3|nr:hypothetical protein [Rathayibacter sp. VKM Ac-2760]QHC57599.1 hypothetical protein GSU72_02620 [Rathayibacter sp. VKM Ac-2760]